MRPRKITLGQADEQRDEFLVIHCEGMRADGVACHHAGRMPLAVALARFPRSMRLDEMPFTCSRCGSRAPDVRSSYAAGVGGKRLSGE